MKNLNLKPFIYILLTVSCIAGYVFAFIGGMEMQSVIDFIKLIPKVVTVDLVIAGLFVKWVWRWRPLQGWLVPFPDLNGTWEGVLQTDWRDAEGNTPGPIPTILTIKQSFTHISCVMRTGEMESHSYVEGFNIDPDKQIRRLCYSYTSKPKVTLRERSTPHDGTISFNIIEKPERKLEGEYWTQRNTTGSVVLSFKGNDLLETMPEDMQQHPMAKK